MLNMIHNAIATMRTKTFGLFWTDGHLTVWGVANSLSKTLAGQTSDFILCADIVVPKKETLVRKPQKLENHLSFYEKYPCVKTWCNPTDKEVESANAKELHPAIRNEWERLIATRAFKDSLYGANQIDNNPNMRPQIEFNDNQAGDVITCVMGFMHRYCMVYP